MIRLLSIIIIFLAALGAFAAPKVEVIPQPCTFNARAGSIKVPDVVTIVASDKAMRDAASIAAMQMRQVGLHADVKKRGKAFVTICHDPTLAHEQYHLTLCDGGVEIKAGDAAGAFYALHTLRQMLLNAPNGEVECCDIADAPRFGYRGIMLDVSRYFIPMDEVKRIVDVASQLKINYLHLHLTDDNGWRMEIKRYPLLTKVGAWRVARDEIFPGRMNQQIGEDASEGGFYTQSELHELVRFAGERFVEVIPEIDMPAHSVAAIASYPSLACPVVQKPVTVLPGIGGKDAAIVMCAGNDSTYRFVQGVLDEVLDVFPSKYIHIGGDEASKTHWGRCPLCQKRIANEHLANGEELQGYFMDSISCYLQSKGRKAICWDEVTYGNPKEDMVIMGWQGMGANAVNYASKFGNRFIMTPARKLYLIRYQGPQWFEPLTYFGDNTLSDVYNYEPVQPDWSLQTEQQLWGVQASMWTEFCRSAKDVEYMLFPRLIAFADMSWRAKGAARWSSFEQSLDAYLPLLDKLDVIYARSMWNLYHKSQGGDGRLRVNLSCIRDDVEIRYTTDGSTPVAMSPLYSDTISITSSGTLQAATFKGGVRCGEILTLNVNVNKATAQRVIAPNATNDIAYVLTNGLRGSCRNSDLEWSGWYNQTAEFVVDLGREESISTITLGSLANSALCVAAPAMVSAYVSSDNHGYTLVKSVALDKSARFSRDPKVIEIDFGKIHVNARYVKFVAVNSGCIPDGFAREGSPTWLYFDEIIVK